MKENLVEGVDFYFSPEGYVVLTEKYHLDKGYCCGYGCRHCPYQYENVPEPRRSELLQNKATHEEGR
ncbi:MAG: hypothetical protein K2P88_02785 [Chitinophagaceae bacterium]|uniref:DUF5522 domain-containing protein n=1 Tax=unclassified Paraflavitalea TaxID=2798305 RepID=UPI003D330179|nr:hypothetical protein [Chitinophagaceae bacterium]